MERIRVDLKGKSGTKDIAASLLIKAGSPAVEEDNTNLIGYLPKNSAHINFLKENLKNIGWGLTASHYKDADWLVKWKKYIKPIRVQGFLVCPPWKRSKKRKGEIEINIDPGMAFGTGAHASTKTCLKAISIIVKKYRQPSMLDIGTGSGILAIAGKKLKIKKVIGIDTDPIAVKVARENAKKNLVKIAFTTKSLDKIPGKFGLVAANIQSSTLLELKNKISKKVSKEGFLVLSGILTEEAEGLIASYSKSGFKPVKVLKMKEWAAVIMRKS